MRKIKLFPKIFIYTFSILSLLVILMHLLVYLIFPKIYVKNIKNEVIQKSNELSRDLKGKDKKDILAALDIYSKSGNIKAFVARRNNSEDTTVIEGLDIEEGSENNFLVIEERTILSDIGEEINVQFMSANDLKKSARDISLQFLPYTLLASFLFSIIASYVYTRIIISPIIEIKKVTNEMMNLNRKAQLEIKSQDEIADLKIQVNSLYNKLLSVIDDLDLKNKRMIEIEKMKVEFLRSTSHELKTPLASLNIILENMKYNIGKYKDRDTYLDKSIEIVDQLSKMIREILAISSSHELYNNRERINIYDEINLIIENYKILLNDKKLQISIRINDESIFISRISLNKVFTNIISNAIKYSKIGGKISVYIEKRNNINYLYIENTGTQMSDEEISESFDLFYSKGDERGNGLGLFIVKNILINNQINYIFERTNEGMRFGIELN